MAMRRLPGDRIEDTSGSRYRVLRTYSGSDGCPYNPGRIAGNGGASVLNEGYYAEALGGSPLTSAGTGYHVPFVRVKGEPECSR